MCETLDCYFQSDLVGMDATSAANLIAIIALSMLVGRIVSGLIGDRMVCCPPSCRQSNERRLFHYAIPMTLAGLANAGIFFWQSRLILTIYSSAVGFLTGTLQ